MPAALPRLHRNGGPLLRQETAFQRRAGVREVFVVYTSSISRFELRGRRIIMTVGPTTVMISTDRTAEVIAEVEPE